MSRFRPIDRKTAYLLPPSVEDWFDQCYNAQAAVATESMLVVATTLTQAGNDKEQVKPMLTVIATLPAQRL
jgi:hypothetical protein